MYKICVHVPEDSVEKVKQALFDAGAGRIGKYDSCCWQTDGVGQFRPLDGSSPAIGSVDHVEHVQEIKLEMVCDDAQVRSAIEALRSVHPYEEPAFDVWRLEEM